MPAATAVAPDDVAGDTVAVDEIACKYGSIAKELERLAVALADHLGLWIVVKDPDQLPRV